MERLTRKSDSMVWFIDREHKSGYAEREPCEMDAHHSRLAIEKLAEYEDLEEQGKLLKLPCAVGDTYFKIETAFWREEQECQGCRYYHTGSDVFRDDSCCLFEEEKWPSCAEIVEKRFESVKEVISYMEDYPEGKTVFPTHEEAEAALEKLERE